MGSGQRIRADRSDPGPDQRSGLDARCSVSSSIEFPLLTSVIVHPSTVVQHGERSTGGSVRSSSPQMLLGQAHYRGPVLLSWSAARRGAKFPLRGENVVYHEFAHQLDMIDGITDGTPPLGDDEDARERGYGCAPRRTTRCGPTVRKSYAPTPVPTRPSSSPWRRGVLQPAGCVAHYESELYAKLVGFYRQDPAGRVTPRGHRPACSPLRGHAARLARAGWGRRRAVRSLVGGRSEAAGCSGVPGRWRCPGSRWCRRVGSR